MGRCLCAKCSVVSTGPLVGGGGLQLERHMDLRLILLTREAASTSLLACGLERALLPYPIAVVRAAKVFACTKACFCQDADKINN